MEDQARVAMLRPVEGVLIDPACLAALRDNVGGAQAARIMSEALEDLALGLSRVAGAYRDDRMDDLRRDCVRIGRIANRIGLDRMGRVAFTVVTLTRGSDGVALAANLARLMRMGHDSLGLIWTTQDHIG